MVSDCCRERTTIWLKLSIHWLKVDGRTADKRPFLNFTFDIIISWLIIATTIVINAIF